MTAPRLGRRLGRLAVLLIPLRVFHEWLDVPIDSLAVWLMLKLWRGGIFSSRRARLLRFAKTSLFINTLFLSRARVILYCHGYTSDSATGGGTIERFCGASFGRQPRKSKWSAFLCSSGHRVNVWHIVHTTRFVC